MLISLLDLLKAWFTLNFYIKVSLRFGIYHNDLGIIFFVILFILVASFKCFDLICLSIGSILKEKSHKTNF